MCVWDLRPSLGVGRILWRELEKVVPEQLMADHFGTLE